MKIKYICIIFLLFTPFCFAADLLEVYNQAQISDPIFQQEVAKTLSTKEGVPISIGALLPDISGQIRPALTRTGFSGTSLTSVVNASGELIYPRNTTTRSYAMALTIRQTIFDFSKFLSVASELALSKAADANLNAALQNLMTRVATAYFNILKDEDNLQYSEASKRAYALQLAQVRQQYEVGLKTITDVYMAKASYDLAIANAIAAQTTLMNDRENLWVITGKHYPSLLTLSDDFPLITPEPNDINAWVKIAEQQNWSFKASQYLVEAAKQNIRRQYGGHLPTVEFEGTMDRFYRLNINRYIVLNNRNGPGTQTDRQAAINIHIPIFSGGQVLARTDRAFYDYQYAQQKSEQVIRDTLNITRQSFLGIVYGISQVKADLQAIKSNMSSLAGMEASYQVGTETLYDVLNQQQKVYQAQTQYAKDRYTFVNNIFSLKQAAGTLCFDDLRVINAWLIPKKPMPDVLKHIKKKHHKQRKKSTLPNAVAIN